MKILLTANDITIGGGLERVVCNLANAFNELGFNVEILSFYNSGGGGCKFDLDSNIKLTFYEAKFNVHSKNFILKAFTKTIYRLFVAARLKALYKDKDFIIHNCYFYPLFKNKKTKYIKIKHSDFKNTYTYKDKIFDALVVISLKEMQLWQKKFNNVYYIPNFMPTLAKQETNTRTKTLLSIGRMSEDDIKGFARLIEIWSLLSGEKDFKEWKLVIVGEGEFKPKLEALIKQKGLSNCILKPFTKNIKEEYLNASIYCLSSYKEGLPTVLLEACSFALPCVAFDILTGPSDIIVDGKSGFLILDGDLKTYANKLKLLMSDESLRKNFGQNARQIVSEKFSKLKILEKWLELFKLLQNKA
ncbi:glycosyltransferase family 4 protein [Helicobacter turcicus]|uniref:glycosyltransferase family 4 protein n=1 Tax=Helicobacter turcicus TaxID=2867412 RepID=UPI001C87B2BA|nr:glycosyltransferase family 4 protein [Helicobacter turcicus]MBX7545498.1 glycosyltransferase family 4 protein [Helicobacter turcicus]